MLLNPKKLQQLNRTYSRAKHLQSKIDTLAAKVAKLDGHQTLDQDRVAGAVQVKEAVPHRNMLRRLFSFDKPVTGNVKLAGPEKQPVEAKLESNGFLLSRNRLEMTTGINGDKTYSRTKVYPIGEELVESYTFHPNGTVSVNVDR